MRSLSVLYTTTSITMLLLHKDVMFRYFVQDSSVIIDVLQEPFIDDGMVTACVYNGVMSSNYLFMYMSVCVYVCPCATLCMFLCPFVCLCVFVYMYMSAYVFV